MTGLDLSGVRSALNGLLLLDAVKIVRDNGNADDVLDEDTNLLVPAERTLVYEGPGAVLPLSPGEGGDPDTQRYYQAEGAEYRALLPLAAADATPVLKGDLLTVTTVTSASSDPRLVDRAFAVVDRPVVSSFAVVRIVYLRPV